MRECFACVLGRFMIAGPGASPPPPPPPPPPPAPTSCRREGHRRTSECDRCNHLALHLFDQTVCVTGQSMGACWWSNMWPDTCGQICNQTCGQTCGQICSHIVVKHMVKHVVKHMAKRIRSNTTGRPHWSNSPSISD